MRWKQTEDSERLSWFTNLAANKITKSVACWLIGGTLLLCIKRILGRCSIFTTHVPSSICNMLFYHVFTGIDARCNISIKVSCIKYVVLSLL